MTKILGVSDYDVTYDKFVRGVIAFINQTNHY
jgi:hypothetical protein